METTTQLEKLTIKEMNEHRATLEKDAPAVYCGTYHKYNCGSLFGMWIDLSSFDDYVDFMEFCHRLHADEADPELMFQDFENFPEEWYCESSLTEETFNKIIEFCELDEDEREAFEAFIAMTCDSEADIDTFRDRYQGKYDDGADFAEQLCEECGDLQNVPNWLQSNIDWRGVWRDMECDGSFSEYDGYIFSN